MHQSTIAEVNSEVYRALLVLRCLHNKTAALVFAIALDVQYSVKIFDGEAHAHTVR